MGSSIAINLYKSSLLGRLEYRQTEMKLAPRLT